MARKKVVVSSRVSRVAGRDGDSFGSPEVQEKTCLAHCKQKRYVVSKIIRELDVSGGTEMHKRELEDSLRAIEEGELDGIVVAKIDRFSRDMLGGLLAIDRIHKAGGFIVAVDDGIDTSEEGGSMGKLWLYILLAFADWYRLQRAEGFEVVKGRAVERGVHISGKVPVGYLKSDSGVLVEDPEMGPKIRQAFLMRAEKASLGEISVFLGDWSTTRTSQTLKNRVYLGEARQGKHVKPDAHEALVETHVFDIVQSLFRRSDVTG